MQGIQLFEYKCLQESLDKLRQAELTNINMPCEHSDLITAYKEKLEEIYTNYRKSREEVALVITQFEEHKLAIRRLIAHRRQNGKTIIRNKKGLLH